VKRAVGRGVAAGHMVAVVGELLARGKAGGLTDDLVAFDDQMTAIGVIHHPFAPEQRDGVLGGVEDRDEVNKGVRLVRWQRGSTVVVVEFVEAGG